MYSRVATHQNGGRMAIEIDYTITGLFGQDDGENQVKQKRTIMDS